MHWRRILLVVVLATATAAPAARASWIIGADAGVGIPTGDFSDFWASGFYGGLAVDYLLSPRFAIGVDVSHTEFGPSDEYQALLDFIDPGADNQFSTWQYGAHGKWLIPVKSQKLSPFLLGGLGFYDVSDNYESPSISDELSQTAFGFKVGLGLDYWMSPKFALGIDANYNDVFPSEDEIGHDTTPYFSVAAGIRWKPGSSK